LQVRIRFGADGYFAEQLRLICRRNRRDWTDSLLSDYRFLVFLMSPQSLELKIRQCSSVVSSTPAQWRHRDIAAPTIERVSISSFASTQEWLGVELCCYCKLGLTGCLANPFQVEVLGIVPNFHMTSESSIVSTNETLTRPELFDGSGIAFRTYG
jgi:hypothetical protein